MRDALFFAKLRVFLAGWRLRYRRLRPSQWRKRRRARRLSIPRPRFAPRLASPFGLEPLEARVLLAADLSGLVAAHTLLDPSVPTNAEAATIRVLNDGTTRTDQVSQVAVYASLDSTLDASDVLLGTANAPRRINAGSFADVTVPLTMSGTLDANTYRLLARVDATNVIAEGTAGEANNLAVGPTFTVAWQFGAVPGRTGNTTLTLQDADGTRVSFSLSGGGTGEVIRDGSQWDVRLTGTTAQSLLSIQTSGGNGRVTVDDLHVFGPLGAVNAATTDLVGTLAVDGPLTAGVLLRSATGAVIAAPNIVGTTVQGFTVQGIAIVGNLTNSSILIGATLGQDGQVGGTGANTDTFGAGALGDFIVGGSMTGSTVRVGQDPVDGIFDNGDDVIQGGINSSIRSITIFGSLSANSQFIAGALPATAKLGGQTIQTASNPVQFKTDLQGPVLAAALANDTGASATDRLTKDPSIAGSLTDPNGIASFVAGFTATPTVNVLADRQPDGSFTFSRTRLEEINGAPLTDGSYTLTLRATDTIGNPRQVSVAFTLDTLAPALTFDLDPTFDTQIVGDQQTTAAVVTVVGQTEANALVELLGLGLSTTADPTGLFTFTNVSLALGANALTARATDAAGNERTFSRTITRVAAPVLGGIGNQTVNEEQALTFTATATDADTPATGLSFSLQNAPAGATVNASTGVFNWTPTEAQGPGTYTFDVVVTDNGSPALSDSETIQVTVNEVNQAPVLNPIGNQTVNEGEPLTFTASATDGDLPANSLTYSLQGTIPAGAAIDPATGAFSWTPTVSQAGSHALTVRVTDNGTPSLFAEQQFSVQVNPVVTTVRWINPNGGDWHTASNWDTGVLPTADQDVIIDIAVTNPITHSTGMTQIKSLSSTQPVTLSGGTLTISGSLQVDNNISFVGGSVITGGDVTLNVPGSLTLNSAIDAGGDITLIVGGNLTINSMIDSGTNAVTVDVAGSISQIGGSVMAGTAILNAANGITLTSGSITNLEATNDTSGTISITGMTGAMDVDRGGVTNNASAGDITLATTGALTLTSDVNVEAGRTVSLTGGTISQTGGNTNATTLILVSTTNMTLSGLVATSLSARSTSAGTIDLDFTGNLTVVNAGGLNTGIVNPGGTVILDVPTGAFVQNGTIDVTGSSITLNVPTGSITRTAGSFTAGTAILSTANGISLNTGSITNLQASNSTSGNISTTGMTGPMTITPSGVSNLGGNVTLQTTGTLTLTGDVIASGTLQMNNIVSFTGGTVITTGDQIYNRAVVLGANTTLSGNNITFNDTVNSDTTLRSLTVNSTNGTITFGGAVGATSTLSSLSATAGSIIAVNDGFVTTGDVTLTAAGNVTISGDANAGGTLTAVGGTISQIGGSVRAGTAILNAANGITLTSGSIAILEAINETSGNISITGMTDALTVGRSGVNNLAAAGNITLATTGALVLASDVTVQFDRTVSLAGGTISQTGGEPVADILNLTSVNGTTLNNLVAANLSSINTGAGNMMLSVLADVTTIAPGLANAGGNITLTVPGDLTIRANVIASGTITLNVTGDLINEETLSLGVSGQAIVTGGFTNFITGVVDIDIGGIPSFGRLIIAGPASLDGTLDVTLVNGFVPAPGDRFQFMTFDSRSGFFSTTNLPANFTVDQTDPSDLELVVTAPNSTPVLSGIGNKTVDELQTLTFTATATDPNAGQTLSFSLANGATGQVPAGAAITAAGIFTWTPSEAQGPGTYTFDVVVADNGTPVLSDSETITVTVNDMLPTLSMNDVTVTEGDTGTTNAVFTVTLTGVKSLPATVDFATADGTATAGSDYVATNGTLTFAPGETSQQITVVVTGDLLREFPSETFVVNLSNESGATIVGGQGQGTILDDPEFPRISIGDVTVTEGNLGTTDAVFTVTQSDANGFPVLVDYETVDGTAKFLDSDYQFTNGILTFAPDETTKTITVGVIGDTVLPIPPFTDDSLVETFFVNISWRQSPSPIVIGTDQGQGTILDDDGSNQSPILSPIGNQNVDEGSTLTFTATATDPNAGQTLSFGLANGATGQVPAGAAITAAGTFTWTPSEAQGPGTYTFDLVVTDNGFPALSDSETIQVTVNTPVTLSIGDFTAAEGLGPRFLGFTVTLSAPVGQPVTVDFATGDGTAVAGVDYTNTSGTLTFAAGETVKGIPVTVHGDEIQEANETFFMNLSNPTNVTIGDGQAMTTLVNDDLAPPPFLVISDRSVTEGDAGTTTAVFTVSRLGPTLDTRSRVDFATANGTATAGSDYVETNGTLNFVPGENSKQITVAVMGDLALEQDEAFTVVLSNPVDVTITDGVGTGTIISDDSPGLSIDDVTIAEGDAGTRFAVFTVSLVGTVAPVTVDFSTSNGTAIAGSDYLATSGTLIFAPGTTSQQIMVTINGDLTFEPNETFFVNLSNSTNFFIADGQATGTITNDDATITIFNIFGPEFNSQVIRSIEVGVQGAVDQPVTVDFATADGTAIAGIDYVATSGTLTFTSATTQFIPFTVYGDSISEPNEQFVVTLRNVTNATIADGQGIVILQNDDTAPPPALAISDATVIEGNSGTTMAVFTVNRFGPTLNTRSRVDFATADAIATAGNDYVATTGTLTFAPGESSKQIAVMVNGDVTRELVQEMFSVILSNAVDATIVDSQGVGTILDDDGSILSIDDVTVAEGDAGTTNAVFTVTLANSLNEPVTVNFATVGVSAAPGSDYVSTSGVLNFGPLETSKQITVVVNGDATFEPSETFFVTLSNAFGALIADNQGIGTITNDDVATTLSITDVTVMEGDAGTATAMFTVNRVNGLTQTLTVDFATANGSAVAGVDYVATSGTLTFNPGETTQAVAVTVNGDTTGELNETFFVNLSNAVNATINDPQGIGTISNDDPTLFINNVATFEGNAGTTALTFTVTLAAPIPGQTVTVDFATAVGGGPDLATAGIDYVATSGTLIFAPGVTTQTITVMVNGDLVLERDETFVVNLFNAVGATILDSQGMGTIRNDD